MGLKDKFNLPFGGGKKKDPGGEGAPSRSGKEVNMGSRGKEESILPESVFETMASIMRQNKKFVVQRDGETYYVGAYLPLDLIGGLSKKDMRDESKGAIVNAISKGTLASIYNSDLAKENAVLFIPNADTVEFMGDFSLLAETAIYELCLVDPSDESIEHTGVKLGHDGLAKIHAGRATVTGLLGDILADAHFDDKPGRRPAPEPEPEPEPGPEFEDDGPEPEPDDYGGGPSYEEDGPDGDDGTGPDYDGSGDEDGPEPEFEDVGGPEGQDGDPSGPGEDGPGEDGGPEPEEEPEVYVDPAVSLSAVERRFFNSDLTHALSTSGLDQRIAALSGFRPLEYKPENWLGDQMNVLIDQANQELFILHMSNLSQVRQEYLSMLQAAYQEVMSQVDDIQSDERYAAIARMEADNEPKIEELISRERERLEAEWEATLKSVGDAARTQAERTYRAKFEPAYKDSLKSLDNDVRLAAARAVQAKRDELKNVRLREAQNEMDARDSGFIAELATKYEGMCKSEAELRARKLREIAAYMDEHRAEQVARDKVATEQTDYKAKLDAANAEWKNKFDGTKADFDARLAQMAASLETVKQGAQADLQAKDRERMDVERRYEQTIANKDARIDRLVADMARVDEQAQAKYQNQINNITSDRDLLSTKYQGLIEEHKTVERKWMFRTVLAGVGAFVVGLLLMLLLRGVLGGGSPDRPDPTDVPSVAVTETVPGPEDSQDPAMPSVEPPAPTQDPAPEASEEFPGTNFNDW